MARPYQNHSSKVYLFCINNFFLLYKGVPRVLKKKKRNCGGDNPGLGAEALFPSPWHKETEEQWFTEAGRRRKP